jgi:hypothetical protein
VIADLASVQRAEHLKDARCLAVRGPLGPPLAGAVQERPEVTVARMFFSAAGPWSSPTISALPSMQRRAATSSAVDGCVAMAACLSTRG